jgi:hypothetical protein
VPESHSSFQSSSIEIMLTERQPLVQAFGDSMMSSLRVDAPHGALFDKSCMVSR